MIYLFFTQRVIAAKFIFQIILSGSAILLETTYEIHVHTKFNE